MADKALNKGTLLRLKDLDTGYSARRNPVVISRKIETSLALGQFVAILGPNGAGKSTLMKTILGHLVPLSGDVLWKGQPLHQMSVKQVARCMSAVLTDKIDDRYLTAMDVVSTGRYPYGSLTGKLTLEDLHIILASMKSTGVTHLSKRRFYSLSDGEKQKTMIARAISQNTPLICLDEPTAFIDSPGKVAIMQLLKGLVADKTKTVLLTTHDSELALQFADELWLVGKNHTFEAGTPKTLIKNGHINQLFDQEGVIFNPDTLRFESKHYKPEL
ncbi:MAG: ABC transporter ATP-binding protein [Candidatus Aquicultor sp.]